MQPLHYRALTAAIVLIVAIVAVSVSAQDKAPTVDDPMVRAVETMPLASQSLMLDITRVGERYVAVGERGQILVSADGDRWTQSNVPLRSTFTAISAIGAKVWVVGHDGVILHSADGGDNWVIQRRDPWTAAAEGEEHYLRQGVPLLDVLFIDANHGIAIGAYSLLLRTSDGGATWNGSRISEIGAVDSAAAVVIDDAAIDDGLIVEEESDTFSADELKIGQESDPHLNGIARTGSGALVVVGERGAIFRSRDDGASWERSQLPYDGSMFGAIGYDGDRVVAFGLRGHVFETTDLGSTWVELPTATELSLMGGIALADAGAVIVGANGTVLSRRSGNEPLRISTYNAAGVIAGVLPAATGGGLLIAGENGLSRFQPK
ncbi:MAG: YCF48-related protein [Dokdonella sp.]